jgi:hypothetical protein
MSQLTPSFTAPSKGCEFDWGASFGVDPGSRKGYLACVSDAVADGAGIEVGYGQEVSLAGITGTSLKTGMTCVNPAFPSRKPSNRCSESGLPNHLIKNIWHFPLYWLW